MRFLISDKDFRLIKTLGCDDSKFFAWDFVYKEKENLAERLIGMNVLTCKLSTRGKSKQKAIDIPSSFLIE